MAWGSPAKVLRGNFVVDVVPLLEERCVCTIFRKSDGKRGKTRRLHAELSGGRA